MIYFLAGFEISLIYLLWSRKLHYYFSTFSWYLIVHTLACLTQLPRGDPRNLLVWFLTAAFATATSLSIFRIPLTRTFLIEQTTLRNASIGIGVMFVWLSIHWQWKAETYYQTMLLIRQYYLIGLFVSVGSAWLWLTWIKPVQIPKLAFRHGTLWCLWLFNLAVGSTTVKHGLMWYVADWKPKNWQAANNTTLAAACLLIVAWIMLLRPDAPEKY